MIFSLLRRIQVEARHDTVKFHLGSFYDEFEGKFAWDYSLYLKQSYKPLSEKDKYHYPWSPIIFDKFECHPDTALVPTYKQLRQSKDDFKDGKGESKDGKHARLCKDFCKDARNRIMEMMPEFRNALYDAKMAVIDQLTDKDLVLLGELMEKIPKGTSFVDIILSSYLFEGYSSEHDYQGFGYHATSAPQEDNTSAAKTLVLKRINDEDWLMLGQFVPLVGIGYIMFTLCSFLSEVSPCEQDFPIDAHQEIPVQLQERNSGYASFDHAQNSTTSEALAGPSSNMDDQVLMDPSSGYLDSGLAPCKVNPQMYGHISTEDDDDLK